MREDMPNWKIEFDTDALLGEIIDPLTHERQVVEIEIIEPEDLEINSGSIKDPRRKEIEDAIQNVDSEIADLDTEIARLNTHIDSLTNKADWLDYSVAIGSGVLAGIIDSVFVGKFSWQRAADWGGKKIDQFVVKIAQSQGFKGTELRKAVKYLEDHFPLPSDSVTHQFGQGSHHILDMAHHPSPVGLIFSILTVFTGKGYGFVSGSHEFISIPLGTTSGKVLWADVLAGQSISSKIEHATKNWFFHLVSDMSGSTSSFAQGYEATSLPGPIGSLLSELSALPIFRDKDGTNALLDTIKALYDGNYVDPFTGEKLGVRFNMRTELGLVHEVGRQSIPVIVNESIVRGFYFVRRLINEIKQNRVRKFKDIKSINWKNIIPAKNRTIVRMLTISTGIATGIDLLEAAIQSKGVNPACLLLINFVGLGRFVIAAGTDIAMGVKRARAIDERIDIRGKQLQYLNSKIFYRQAGLWIEAENTAQAMENALLAMKDAEKKTRNHWDSIEQDISEIKMITEHFDSNRRDFTDEFTKLTKMINSQLDM